MNKILFTKVALIIVNDRRVLFVRERGNDIWLSPGGKKKEGESDCDALIREINEELTVMVNRETIRHETTILSRIFDSPDGMFRLVCYTAGYSGTAVPSNEVIEMKYMSSTDTDNMGNGGKMLLQHLKNKNVID